MLSCPVEHRDRSASLRLQEFMPAEAHATTAEPHGGADLIVLACSGKAKLEKPFWWSLFQACCIPVSVIFMRCPGLKRRGWILPMEQAVRNIVRLLWWSWAHFDGSSSNKPFK